MRHIPALTLLMFFFATVGFAQDIDVLVRSRLTQEQKVNGWLAGDISDWRITDQYTDRQTGFTYAYVQQRYNNIPVYNAISVFLIKDSEVRYFRDGLVSDLENSVTAEKAVITAEDAVGFALTHLGEAKPSGLKVISTDLKDNTYAFDAPAIARSPVSVQLVYRPTEKGVKLAWNVSMEMKNDHHWWNVRVDATTGEFIDKNDYTVECNFENHDHAAPGHVHFDSPQPYPSPSSPPPTASSSYNVFALPVEAPTFGSRSLTADPFDPAASPFGWHDVNGVAGAEYTITRGNNVFAYEDADNNNLPGFSPDGGASLTFDFPYTFGAPAISNQSASITNLFYASNRIHDMVYRAGFTEQAGNFQVNNYGLGGLGNDQVNAEAFDGAGTNNANFSAPPDGSRGRMQMYLWTGSGQPDGSFDNGIILHEYGHGVSIRLTGGPSNSGCLNNAEQAGEGWSDWLALISTIEPGDNGAMARGIGTYALSQSTTGPGIRRYPYSTNMTINPQTYASLPGSAIPHGVGEIWCDAIWDMTWFLIEDLGFNPDPTNTTSGNYIALRLVLEGMKLQPCSPGFLDSRNAILLADDNLYSGVHKCRIWEAFARRGMGYNAVQGSSNSINDQVADFTKPPICQVVTGPPVAAFVGNVTPCTKTVVFTDQSVQATDFSWDFGDGTTSIVQNPVHTYATSGNYNVTLTVTNSMGTDQVTHPVIIADPPIAVISGNHNLCPTGSVVLDAGTFSSYLWSTGASTQQITVTAPATYSVTVTNINGCPGHTSVTTTNLLSTSISGQNILCVGGSNTLDAGAYAGYLWSGGQTTQSITVDTPGEYSVTVTDADGCIGMSTTNVTRTVVAGLTTILSNPGNVICAGNSTTLTVDTTLMTTSAEQTFSQPGVITVSATAAVNGNPYPSTIAVSGLPLSGVTVKTVSLNGVSHTFPDDLDILLQSPTGTNVVMMSDAGGGGDLVSQNCTFKDGFPLLSNESQLSGGTYSPTNYGVPDTWDAPGPGSFSQASPSLSLFSGNFNGIWNLLVRDDLVQDGGSITSWSITFEWQRSGITYTWSPATGLSTTTGASTTASPSATTTYTVTATDDDSGCTNTVDATVTVEGVLPVITGNLIICEGDSTTLETGLFASYLWSTGDTTQSISVNTAGSYAVTVTNANGCTSGATPAVVAIDPLPTASISVMLADTLIEGFNNIAALPANGWFLTNNSSPLGITDWFQGNGTVFPAQDGTANEYIGTNFNNTTGTGTISNWLMTPARTFVNGDSLSFWTRTVTSPAFPDRLEVRLSLNGSSTNVGSTATSTGDFTTLLLTVNPTLTTSGYPNSWTRFNAVISGLSSPTSGRIAFRYFVTDGGPNGANSDYIGLDHVEIYPEGMSASTICSGNAITITGASASNGTILWSHDGEGALSNATTLTPTYTSAPADAGTTVTLTMTVTGTNTCGDSTAIATLAVNVCCLNPTDGGAIAANQNICYNTVPAAFTSTAPATGNTGILRYQWQSSPTNNPIDFADISSATQTTYQPAALTQTTWFRRLASVTCKSDWTGAASSNLVKVTVYPSFTRGSISESQGICYNTAPAELNGVAPTGGCTPYSYQWQSTTENPFDTPPVGFTDISGATSLNFEPGTLNQTTFYRLKQASASGCGIAITDTVTITVEPIPVNGVLTKIPDVPSVCFGADLSATFTAGSGGNGTDVVQYRTKEDGTWSGWLPYDQNHSILTNTIDSAQIIIYRAADYCENSIPDSVSWQVTSPSIGGTAIGGTQVCNGVNSTVLSLTGQNGTVQRWELSTDNEHWTNIDDSTGTTFTAVNLTQDTWYRALIQSGTCEDVHSVETQITVLSDLQISGFAKYENNPHTPLNGLKVVLNKLVSSTFVKVDSVETNALGFYEFEGLANATYGLSIKSAHPSGQWQTWGGVNNTDYLLVAKHVAGTSLLPVNPPVIMVSASVKVPHPLINSVDANAIRQAAKYPVTGWSFFDIPKWVFSGLDQSSRIDTMQLGCANVTRDIRGLCAGDVNGTYVPVSGYKMATPNLQLVNRGTLPITREITFPVRAEQDMELGAITLMLDYDPSLIEITGVTMPENSGAEPWFEVQSSKFQVAGTLNLEPETLNMLNIGWMSLNPVNVSSGQTILLIKARLKDEFQISDFKSEIRFTLNENPLSELADGDGNVLDDARLSVPNAGFKVQGSMFNEGTSVMVYPNPVKDVLNVEIVIDDINIVTNHTMALEIVTMHGVVVAKQNVTDIQTGMNKTTIDLRDLPNGAYLLKVNGGEIHQVVKVVVNR